MDKISNVDSSFQSIMCIYQQAGPIPNRTFGRQCFGSRPFRCWHMSVVQSAIKLYFINELFSPIKHLVEEASFVSTEHILNKKSLNESSKGNIIFISMT